MAVSIYKLTFSSGKSYIGVSKDLARRFRDHTKLANIGSKQAVHCAFRKYGTPKVSELFCAFTQEDAYAVEQQLIQLENTLAPNGYNIAIGGIGNLAKKDYKGRSIVDQNGIVYPSIRAAARKINKRYQDVWKVLNKHEGRTQISGYQFTYCQG